MIHTKKQKIEIECNVCRKKFLTSLSFQKTCSTECRKKRAYQVADPISSEKLSSATVGSISEMAVSVDLMKKGFAVFRALSPACVCDLIAIDKKQNIFRIEVKTAYINQNSNKMFSPNPVHYNFDILVFYIRSLNKVIYMDKKKKVIEFTS